MMHSQVDAMKCSIACFVKLLFLRSMNATNMLITKTINQRKNYKQSRRSSETISAFLCKGFFEVLKIKLNVENTA